MAKKKTVTNSNSNLTIHNKISAQYRELHVDGAFGGLTPRGYINISFYAERNVIPKSTDYVLNPDSTLGEVVANSEDSKRGIIREFEVGVYMDIKAAEELMIFLQGQLSQYARTKEKYPGFGERT